MFCPKCGFQNADNARFCGKCGHAFAQSASAVPPKPPVAPPDPASAPVPPVYSNPAPNNSTAGTQTPPGAAASPRPITPEMLNAQWYYQIFQLVYGPVTSAAVLKLLNDRIISFDTLVKIVPSPSFPADSGWISLNRTMLMDIYYSGLWRQANEEDVFKSGVNAIKNTINNITGDSGKVNITFSQLFSDVFQKHTTAEADQLFIGGTSLTTPPESSISSGWPKPWIFSRIFLVLGATFGILWLTFLALGNVAFNLFPGLIFMGSLAIPFSVVVFFWEINVPRNISFFDIIKIFFICGALSLLITLFLDVVLKVGKLDFIGATLTGIIEETSKLIAILFFLRYAKIKYTLNGLLIGAAGGAGFAVFETAGYALQALVATNFNLSAAIDSLFMRGALSIGGHVVWTAVAGAAVVMVKKGESLTSNHIFSGKFLQLFIVPVILHAVWDMTIFHTDTLEMAKYGVLIVVVWIFVIKLINSGLKQIEDINKQNSVSAT